MVRYLGGKYRLAPKIRPWLVSHQATRLIEPCTGGLGMLQAVAHGFDEIHACDINPHMIALWAMCRTAASHRPQRLTGPRGRRVGVIGAKVGLRTL